MTRFSTMHDAVLLQQDHRGVATVTLNNPDKHNAFDDAIIAALQRTFDYIAKQSNIFIVVLAANGRNFSAGADLSWMKRMASYSLEDNLADANALASMLYALNHLPQPTIAKVQGAAFGGAVGLVSCCDITVATDSASFCLSEVKLGLIPATISPYVVAAIGVKASRRYFTTAERFFAIKAQQIGLVDDVVSPDELDDSVSKFVHLLLNNGPKAIREAKALIFDVAHKQVNTELMAETSQKIAEIRVSPEGQEGLTAFFEKRQANWLTPTSSIEPQD